MRLGMRVAVWIFLAMMVVGGAMPAAAERLEAYDVVGLDAAADANNYIVPGTNPPDLVVTSLSREKQDILGLEMGSDAETIHVKLNVNSHYGGTSSLMFVVFFTLGGSAYYTCWNIQSGGVTNNYQDVQENSELGCTKFSLGGEGTRVGPTTRANGVDVETACPCFVRWEVPRADVGGAADGDEMTQVVAQTWNRGANPEGLPATSPQSQYVWNLADQAPDEGAWTYVVGGAAAPDAGSLISLTADSSAATVGPASSVGFQLGATYLGNGSTNVSLAVESAPGGWDATLSHDSLSLDEQNNTTSPALYVRVPADAANGSYNVTVSATGSDNATARLNVTITVDTALAASEVGPQPVAALQGPDSGGGNATTNETSAPQSADGGIPGVGLPSFMAALLVGAACIRRRRRAA